MTDLFVLDRGETVFSPSLVGCLPLWRRERTERLHRAQSRQESLAAGLLWLAAMKRRGIEPFEPVMTLPAGKPVFAAREDVFFSLSHSGRYVLCAVSPVPVGADVQQMRKVNLSIARRLHPREQEWLAGIEPSRQQEEFFRLWARKEAWVKAMSHERMLSLGEQSVTEDPPMQRFADYVLPYGYQAAVCLGKEEPAPTPVFFTAETLLKELRINPEYIPTI